MRADHSQTTASRRRFRSSALAATMTLTMLLAAGCGAGPSLARGSGTAFIRVNQVGYVGAASKSAYLMAGGSEAGATFSVRDAAGKPVFEARIGANLGRWSSRYPDVYALDFSSVRTAGSYTVTVRGPMAASSPRFRIDTGAHLYAGAIANAVAFYQAERDGPQFVAGPLRSAPGHLHDRTAMTYLTPKVNQDGDFSGDLRPLGVRIDASGGWWDAGDYLKFVETTSYTVDVQLLGVRDFPTQLGPGFAREARFGTDWLRRMWDDHTRTLYYQVGIGEGNARIVGDHDIWRLPQADDHFGGNDPADRYIRNRPVFRAGPPGAPISPNLAGRDAAAFALCYQVFRGSDPAYANRCLLEGEHIFDLADTAPRGHLLTVIPFDFYPETEWRDDLELGAAELAQALQAATPPAGLPLPHRDPRFYLRQGAHWADAYIHGPNDAADTLNLYDSSALAHADLSRAIARAGDPAGLEVTRAALLADLRKAIGGALAKAGADPFQFGFPWASYDTQTHGTGLSLMASLYDQLSGTSAFADWSGRWLSGVLGANAWGASFIVGDGTTFPHCMQHQVANLVGSLDGSPPLLRGAGVEGPNSFAATGRVSGMRTCPPSGGDRFARWSGGGAVFRDDVQSFSTTEPAIDLTVNSPLAFARQAAGLR